MPIPPVSRDAILEAMTVFDETSRETPEWQGWEHNRAHKYTIEHQGTLYPVKCVISIATGTPVSEFFGGVASG